MERLIFRIAKKFPSPIKNYLKTAHRRWVSFFKFVKLDKDLLKDVANYSGLSLKETLWLFKASDRINADFWRILNIKNPDEIVNFYKITPFYIFSLSFWHMTKTQRKFRDEIIKLAKGEVLDFGAGIGDFCIKLSEKGFNVDYADVPGKTFDFAMWLFAKRGCKINMINIEKEKLQKKYDSIFCIDVIEHIPNPKETLRELAFCLKSGGNLIITGLKNEEDLKGHPMHIKTDLGDEKYLKHLGLLMTKTPWLLIKE